MKLLMLGPHAQKLFEGKSSGLLELTHHDGPVSKDMIQALRPDGVVSFGYKHILSAGVIGLIGSQSINIHISLLPWNRGMHPNFWSWLENTPKGVSIHRITETLDGGNVLAQREVFFEGSETLASSYDNLIREAAGLFNEQWQVLLNQDVQGTRQQSNEGSFHLGRELNEFWGFLDEGWQTRCDRVRDLGREKGRWR